MEAVDIEASDDDGETAGAWVLAGTLVGFKIVTLVAVLLVAVSWRTVEFMVVSHTLWFVVALVVAWVPAGFWLRLLRVRAQRQALVRSEWELSDTSTNPS